MSPDEVRYYRERARQERARAKNAARQDVADIHDDLASLYESLIAVDQPRPTLHVVASEGLSA